MMRDIDIDAVGVALQEVEAAEIAPRFGRLAAADIAEKEPGEIVTAADRAAEVALTARLRDVLDVPVVGEEGAAADPAVLAGLAERPAAWLVDPLDGTSNFAAGSPDYAVMVALVEHGRATASWMWLPAVDVLCVAVRGDGATRNGSVVTMAPPPDPGRCRGVVKARFLPDGVAGVVAANESRFAAYDAGRGCAGYEYPDLVGGHHDFVLYWRTLPWDHAPGALFAVEAGGAAVRPDGSPYEAGSDRVGLVVAHAEVIDEVRAGLFEA